MTFQQLIRGAEIFAKYVPPTEHLNGAEHDVIFFLPRDVEITPEDCAELEALGYKMSREYDAWIHYV